MENIENFIRRFHIEEDDITKVFTSGCCYWFAQILFRRFLKDGAKIMYDALANHFGTQVGREVYDITGIVTNSYCWEIWDEFEDELERQRIIRDCIMF